MSAFPPSFRECFDGDVCSGGVAPLAGGEVYGVFCGPVFGLPLCCESAFLSFALGGVVVLDAPGFSFGGCVGFDRGHVLFLR